LKWPRRVTCPWPRHKQKAEQQTNKNTKTTHPDHLYVGVRKANKRHSEVARKPLAGAFVCTSNLCDAHPTKYDTSQPDRGNPPRPRWKHYLIPYQLKLHTTPTNRCKRYHETKHWSCWTCLYSHVWAPTLPDNSRHRYWN